MEEIKKYININETENEIVIKIEKNKINLILPLIIKSIINGDFQKILKEVENGKA